LPTGHEAQTVGEFAPSFNVAGTGVVVKVVLLDVVGAGVVVEVVLLEDVVGAGVVVEVVLLEDVVGVSVVVESGMVDVRAQDELLKLYRKLTSPSWFKTSE